MEANPLLFGGLSRFRICLAFLYRNILVMPEHLDKRPIKPQKTNLWLFYNKTTHQKVGCFMERASGIEPPYRAWQARVLTIVLRPRISNIISNQPIL